MARNSNSPSAIVTASKLGLLLAVLFAAAYFPTPSSGLGGAVGGRTKIENVKADKEVQDLGRFSVQEYNRVQRRHRSNRGGGDLAFTAVVEAEKQVVSGIKYYLRIAAVARGGAPKTFDAVVVVKPWVHTKQLLDFAPSPASK